MGLRGSCCVVFCSVLLLSLIQRGELPYAPPGWYAVTHSTRMTQQAVLPGPWLRRAAGDGTVEAGNGGGAPWAPLGAVPQRDADLLHLFHKYSAAAGGAVKAAALRELDAEVR